MTSTKWTPEDLPDFTGRTVVITGATSGIGLAAARELARVGARVVLAVRNTARGEELAAEMGGDVEVRHLDLTELASIRAFAEAWEGPIDVLINNAGVMATPEKRTADGFELQIGTNHLGHFALTGLLLEHVTDRVVNIASGAHRMGKVDLDDLNWETRKYDRWKAYGQSKLANLLFTAELERRLTASGSPVKALAAHPGWSATHLQSRTESSIQNSLMALGNKLIAQSDERGAWPTLYAVAEDLPGNTYVGPDGAGEVRGHPTVVGRSKAAEDAETARGLWELSEQLTGVTYPAVVTA